jgi:hypothetical protein
VAAYQDGELIVDAWAGVADAESRQPVDGQTLFWASSVGKGIAATCVHMLAERGRLEYESPVARYWPEFAANGKEGVTVRHVLSHKAGVPTPRNSFETGMLLDWERMCDSIFQHAPLAWERARHIITSRSASSTGELIRHVDNRGSQFSSRRKSAPLGIDSPFSAFRPTIWRGCQQLLQFRLQPRRVPPGVHPVQRPHHQRRSLARPTTPC